MIEKEKNPLENVRELADYAADKNIRIAIENGGINHITGKSVIHRSLLEEINRDNVGACIDTGHANLVEDVAGFLRTIDKYLFTLHIHDNKGEVDNHQLPGWGVIDWPSVIKALYDINYTGIFMYEVKPKEILDKWKNNLKDLINHYAILTSHHLKTH
jgi:sugar phosphate isomerase/epimerase